MARNSNKDIDFLSVYKTKKKININSKTLLLIAFPVLLILIFATSTLYLTITNRNLQKDVDTLQTQIEEALTVTAFKVNGCEETVRTLRESGTFKTVDYNGYTQDGGVSETTETVTDPITGATTTQTVTNTTPITYKSSITCTLEGGTTSGQD